MRLLSQRELESSSVVANCAMNRERQLRGSNSYERDLGLDVLAFLRDGASRDQVLWVDLCCGTGRALIEAAGELAKSDVVDNVRIEGIDLAGMFDANPVSNILTLHQRSLEAWTPVGPYSLV